MNDSDSEVEGGQSRQLSTSKELEPLLNWKLVKHRNQKWERTITDARADEKQAHLVPFLKRQSKYVDLQGDVLAHETVVLCL